MSTDPSMPALDAAAEAESKWLTEILLGHPDCENFRKLEGLRRNIRAAGIRRPPRRPPPTTPQLVEWANTMCGVLHTMSQGSDGFAQRTARFLDIGSNPGGFAHYILAANPNAWGVGVSLPLDSGGVGRAIPPSHRFEAHELDILDLVSSYLSSRVLPFSFKEFDFIVLDADPLRPCVVIAQLLLALHTIVNGGQILIALSRIEDPLTARILVGLGSIADSITAFKPPKVRAWTGIFYLHAQTIRVNTSAYHKFKDNLTRLWNQIQTTYTRDPTWDEQDLITPWQGVLKKSNVDWIIKLGNPLWEIQLTALIRAFDRVD